jgi:hypothetical protein
MQVSPIRRSDILTKPVAIRSSLERKAEIDSDAYKDLDDYCFVWTFEALSDKEFESTKEVLDSARLTESMLKAPTAKERVKAARDLLQQHPDCGLPYLILARDGVAAEREENYRRAVDLLTAEAEKAQSYEEAFDSPDEKLDNDEHFQSLLDWYDDVPYAFEIEGVAYVIAELARLLWQEGRHDDAVACILPALQRLQEYGSQLQAILVSYLIHADKEEQASSLLDQMSLPYAEWYYSKALLLFRKHGDSNISRSALSLALEANTAMANVILTREISDAVATSEYESRFGTSRININNARLAVDASTGWHTTGGAIEWLARTSTRVIPLSALQQMTNPQFLSRAKLWKTNFEIADLQIERGNLKEAKKNARMAFKEARKAGVISNALFESVDQLIQIAEEYDHSFGEIIQCLEELSSECRSIENRNEAISIIAKLAEYYQRLELYEPALKLLDEVITDTECSLEKNEPAVCLDHLAMALRSKGRSLNDLERWQEAKSPLERSLELQESYLSKDHPDLLLNLRLLSRCLKKTDESEKANEMDARFKAIQLAHYGDLSEELEDEDLI